RSTRRLPPFPTRRSSDLTLLVYDSEYRYHVKKDGSRWRLLSEVERHGTGFPPVVRFLDQVGDEDDDDGIVSRGKIEPLLPVQRQDRKSTRLNSSHVKIPY